LSIFLRSPWVSGSLASLLGGLLGVSFRGDLGDLLGSIVEARDGGRRIFIRLEDCAFVVNVGIRRKV